MGLSCMLWILTLAPIAFSFHFPIPGSFPLHPFSLLSFLPFLFFTRFYFSPEVSLLLLLRPGLAFLTFPSPGQAILHQLSYEVFTWIFTCRPGNWICPFVAHLPRFTSRFTHSERPKPVTTRQKSVSYDAPRHENTYQTCIRLTSNVKKTTGRKNLTRKRKRK